MKSDYFQVHSHSEFSTLDGMGSVEDMVRRASKLGHPAMALTDHGTMAGTVRLYRACMNEGIAPFPGIEAYVVTDVADEDEKNNRFHLGLLALDFTGYQGLLRLSSRSFQADRFHRKPLVDLADLIQLGADYGDHVAVTTGCYFGLVVQNMLGNIGGGERMVRMLKAHFKHLFVEVQDHGIYHEELKMTDHDISTALMGIAIDQGLPVVLGQDSHYCEASHQPVHDLMKDICYFGDGEDSHFPGGPYHVAPTDWVAKPWTADGWAMIEEGHAHLLDLNNVSMPALDKYKFCVPEMSTTPDEDLSALAWMALNDRRLTLVPGYKKRVQHELSVIKEMGFANYFLMAYELANWCRKEGVFIDARGSANGSLICFLLGVTTVDSVKWDCDFERFLSLDRKKPPDIDIDVEDEYRDALLEHLWSKFPTMVQIGSYGRIGVTVDPDTGEEKGSVHVQYAAAMRRKTGDFTGVDPAHVDLLRTMGQLNVRKGAGRHAGGFVIPGAGLAIDDYLPTMLVGGKNGVKATQYTMDDVENCGYVKLDILGLKQLSTMRRVMEYIGKDPVKDGMGWIPDDDKKACRLLRSGHTGNGVFQFEGFTTARGARQMKVANTQDGIFCLALFRPAMMASGMTERYLEARTSGQREYLHPGVDGIMANTMGVPIFQDQVIQIMRQVGLPYEDLNDLLKAVKASNDKIAEYALATFDRVKPIFVKAAIANLDDCDNDDAEAIWQTVMDFSDYGFNKPHATNYGIRAYRMAYLKAHHPTEFMAATLTTWAGTKKEAQYLAEARKMNLTIARADVNLSGVNWSIEGETKLRKGLLTVKGIAHAAANVIVDERIANGPFIDVEDFCARLPARPVSGVNDLPKGVLKGICKVLVEAKAMTSLGVTVE